MSKVVGLIKSRWFITIIGLLLLALLIWFGGPYLGIGDSQPLASPIVRLVLIVLIIVAWAVYLQIQQIRAQGKTKQMAGDLAGQDADGAKSDPRDSSERAQLQTRFQEAIDTLRKTRKRGADLYSLPWYVVIGPPGSGKSTLLLNSGLNFPLSNQFGREALRGIGGTRNCDWWFTDEAVFLDTAGRYTTQDSDRAGDASAWQAFLGLLRKYRKRRPINGVIVAMSVSDLLTLGEAGRQDHILAIRQRLDELAQHLRIGVPVYLVFTKCDLAAGFGEFFDDLNSGLRAQVWGVTFPIESTTDGSAATRFASEFDLLLQQLNTRMLDRLHGERDRGRRAAILSFPAQLSAMREMMRRFVEGIFSGHQYATPLLLRGAYFTSGTQEGTPIDRMMGAVARTFGLDASQVHAPGAERRTFFVERLLRDVLFKESGFAGVDPRLERQKILLQLASYAGIALLTGLLVLGFVTSFHNNGSYLTQVEAALSKYPAATDPSSAKNLQGYFALSLERLEPLSAAVTVAERYRGHVPLLMRFGLYQGHAVGNSLHEAYLRELNGLLLPGISLQLRSGLTANAADPQALYYFLKGYLMLGEPKHLDREELTALTNIAWRQLFPDDPVLQKALAGHFDALISGRDQLRPLTLDAALVEQARNTLRTADLPTLIYGSLQLDAQGAGFKALHLDQELGLLGSVFQRRSGKPLGDPLPGLFTQPAFKSELDKGIDAQVLRFAADDWVFGQTTIDPLQKARLGQQVLALYQRDYIKAWDDLLGDLQLRPINGMQDASGIAAQLAGPNSPLKLLLKVLRANTTDMQRIPPGGAADAALGAAAKQVEQKATQSALALALAKANGTSAAAPAEVPGDAITAHFARLNALTEGAPGAAPIDHTMMVLGDLSKTLLTMTDFSSAAGQPNAQLLTARQEAAQLPAPVSAWVAALTGKSESLVASGTKGALGDQFAQGPKKNCAEFVRGRYPFTPSSGSDIPLQNFGELFGVGGSYDSFYKQTLEKLVDTSGGSWHWKTGPGAVAGPPGILEQMQAADEIKQMYFRGGNTPEVDFTLLTPVLGTGVGKLSIDIDGQKFDYQAGGPANVSMKWPGPNPGHVSVAGYDASGTLLAKFEYHGAWAFFRALQAANLQKLSDLMFQATFDFGGHTAQLTIQADNLKNPFLKTDLQRFRCGG